MCLVHSDADVEDDINLSLITHLRHQCHCFLQVQGLGSGFSKDIHGQVIQMILCRMTRGMRCGGGASKGAGGEGATSE